MEDHKDLLDLCRLNQMEENVKDSPAPEEEVETTLKGIDWIRRQKMLKIIHSQTPASSEVMERHIEQNTIDGEYPPNLEVETEEEDENTL